MPEEPAKHANVAMIPQDQFDQIKGLYFYASHRLLKFIDIIREAQRAYDSQGALLYGKSRPDTVSFPRERVEEMESLLVDLEDRLDKMFLRRDRNAETMTEERLAKMQEGKKRSRLERKKVE